MKKKNPHKLENVPKIGNAVEVERLRRLFRVSHDAEGELGVEPARGHRVPGSLVQPHLLSRKQAHRGMHGVCPHTHAQQGEGKMGDVGHVKK